MEPKKPLLTPEQIKILISLGVIKTFKAKYQSKKYKYYEVILNWVVGLVIPTIELKNYQNN